MERKLPDWLEQHLAEKRAKEALRADLKAAFDADPDAVDALDAMPEGNGGLTPSGSTPSCSQSSEEGGGYTLEKLKRLEDRLFQRIDRMNSPSLSQESLGSQDSMGSKGWSDTSLVNDFSDIALVDFIMGHMCRNEIRKLCEPYPIFSRESRVNNADFYVDLHNGLRDHLYVCYRLVVALVEKIEKAVEEIEKETEGPEKSGAPLADVSNSPIKKPSTPTKSGAKGGAVADCPLAPAKATRPPPKRALSAAFSDTGENAEPSSSDSKRVRFSQELAQFAD